MVKLPEKIFVLCVQSFFACFASCIPLILQQFYPSTIVVAFHAVHVVNKHRNNSLLAKRSNDSLFNRPESSNRVRLFDTQEALVSPRTACNVRKPWRTRGKSLLDSSHSSSFTDSQSVKIPEQEGGVERSLPAKTQPSKDKVEKRGKFDQTSLNIPYSSAVKALRAYHSIHGHLAIPRRYIVPFPDGNTTSRYPIEWHGVDLSSTVYNMKWWQKHVKQRPERVSELNKVGFVWGRLQPEWNIVLEALIAYYNLHGNVMVASSFLVPHGDPHWPVATWGIPLGNTVYRIRARYDFFRGPHAADRRNQLDGLGFVWDLQEHRFQTLYEAIRHYAYTEKLGLYSPTGRTKALRIPTKFIVPANDDRWPQELWGFQLGAKCNAVRQKGLYVKNNPERQKQLEELGFRWRGNSMFGWLEVVHSAAIYSKMNNRHLNVPYNFVVPSPPTLPEVPEDWPWPEQLWGLPLGQRLKDVRVRNAYLKGKDKHSRVRQLEALGFVWRPKRGRKAKSSHEAESFKPDPDQRA